MRTSDLVGGFGAVAVGGEGFGGGDGCEGVAELDEDAGEQGELACGEPLGERTGEGGYGGG